MSLPTLSIVYAYPLDVDRRALFADKNWLGYPDVKTVKSYVHKFQTLWNQENADDRIIILLNKILKIDLIHNPTMFVFGRGLKAMSTPFLMPIITKEDTLISDDDFIETTVHELIHLHISQTDIYPDLAKYWIELRKEFHAESIVTQNHLLVYAVLKVVISTLFKNRSVKPITNEAYKRALEIVDEKGSDYFIHQLHQYCNQ